jgi:hypothetical protein
MRAYNFFKVLCLLVFIAYSSHCLSSVDSAAATKIKLETCLLYTWGVDRNTVNYIVGKFAELEDGLFETIVNDFINNSKTCSPDFSIPRMPVQLHEDDGVLQAPEQHLVIFENPWVRILLGSTQPGVRENMHIHEWKSILVIIKPTTFKIMYADGTEVTELYPIGVYELPAMEKYACENMGDEADECVRFEVKG